ncbi:MAG: hypothetical protein KHY76_00160 [Butyricicoccus pullicaecorum]|nr:hypothetical protein [Butyricicoccus pullicaecorum]
MKTLSYAQRKRVAMYIGLAEGLLAICILLTVLLFRQTLIPNTHTFSTFAGLSGGMIGAGFGTFLNTRKLLRDPKLLRQSEIRSMDERNQYISAQSARLSFWISIVLIYITAFFSLFFSTKLYFLLCGQIVVMTVLYLLFNYIFRKIFC